MKAPFLRKTAKKAQPKMQAPVRNFYNQLTQKDKEILLRNGFKGVKYLKEKIFLKIKIN